MLMAMHAKPAAPPAPSRALALRTDTARQSKEYDKRHGMTRARKAMRGLSGVGAMGLTQAQQYSQWYYSTYLPYYTSSQTANQVYQQFQYPFQSLLQRVAAYSPYQYNPYGQTYGTTYNPYNPPNYYGYQTPVYGYSGYGSYPSQMPGAYGYGSGYLPQGDQYLYLRSPQQCSGQGGIWDAFSQSCANPNAPTTGSSPAGTPTGNAPSVLGYSKFAAADMLNRAGYETWLVQEDGGYFNPPQGSDPHRVNIWVSNGVVQRQSLG